MRLQKPREFEGVEVLRFVLASIVLAYHYLWYGPMTGVVSKQLQGPEWLIFGRFGVSAFFIISGFVIVHSARGRTAIDFGIARFTRLAPALLVCATITMFLLWVFPVPAVAPPTAVAYLKSISIIGVLLGGSQADPSYWSIVVEMRFYLAIGLLLWIAGSLRRLDAFAWAWLALSAVALIFPIGFLHVFALSPYSGYFILGIGLYFLAVERRPAAGWLLVVAALTLAGAQTNIDFERVDLMDGVRSPLWSGYAIATTAFLVVFGSLHIRPGMHPVIHTLGAMSYPLYLLHQMIGYWSMAHLAPLGLAAPAMTVFVVLAASWGFVRFVEPVLATWLRSQSSRARIMLHASRLQSGAEK